jgi:hypothetical protein
LWRTAAPAGCSWAAFPEWTPLIPRKLYANPSELKIREIKFILICRTLISDFLMWAVFSRVILEMGMALFFVKMEKIWQDSDRRKN